MTRKNQLASVIAAQSRCRFRHAAIVLQGKRFITGACNDTGTHPKGSGRYKTKHAEVRAIRKAQRILKRDDLSGLTIFVLRLSPSGEVRNSKPCKDCMAAIKSVGLKPEWTG